MTMPDKNPKLAWKKIGVEVLIIDSIQEKEVHRLNEVGSRIWELCDGKTSQAEIINIMEIEFEATKDIIRTDVEEYLMLLFRKGLLVQEGP